VGPRGRRRRSGLRLLCGDQTGPAGVSEGSSSDLQVRRGRAGKRPVAPAYGQVTCTTGLQRAGQDEAINEATCEADVSREALGEAVLFNRTGTR
jgi:hypothetical protein